MFRLIATSLILSGAVALAHADEGTFSRTVQADLHGTVEVSNVDGTVRVDGWDKPEVEVQATLGAGVDKVEVSTERGRTSVRVVVPNHSFRTIATDLHIHVPRESELDVSAVSANVTSANVQGSLELKTVSGNVTADLFQRDAEIKTVSGNITLSGRGQNTSLHLTTISGNIRIEHAAGQLEASTVDGNLNVQLDPTRGVRVRTTSGDFKFSGKLLSGAHLEAETISGALNIHAIPDSGYYYEVSSFSGEIRNCLGAQVEKTSRYAPGERLSGSRGKGGSDDTRIRLKSLSGDVSLCDHD